MTHNQVVPGSSPGGTTKKPSSFLKALGVLYYEPEVIFILLQVLVRLGFMIV